MTISWVVLTYNRGAIVKEAMDHNFETMGANPADIELVWVDNGSTDVITREYMYSLDPEIAVVNNTNLGVARGYNQGLGLATKDYIVITGCDCKMPENWLKIMQEYMVALPGIACVYSKPLHAVPERVRGPISFVGKLPYVPALALERRIFPRALLANVGYFPESLGLYGYDDLAWAMRAEKMCASYVIPNMVAEHLGTEGVSVYDGKDSREYHEMKQKETADPAKKVELNRLRAAGWPRSSPFL